MKIKLTEKSKRFIESLNSEDRAKFIITKDAIESSDDELTKKWEAYLVADFKARMHEIGTEMAALTTEFQKEHPEYFKN